MIAADLCIKAALVGIGGTLVLDLWAAMLARLIHVPATNWAMVGRWIGNMPRGRLTHSSMAQASPVAHEAAIGWTAHYVIGIGYGLLLLALGGEHWLLAPTLLPPMIICWGMLVAPLFIMMPGMGSGIAGSKMPRPNLARLKSIVSHSIFGLGMYATALALNKGS